MPLKKRTAFTSAELSYMCSQISWMLESAIPLEEGIAVICENTENPEQKQMLQHVCDLIAQNGSFSQSVNESGYFPPYMVHMVEIGKKTGKLDEIMARLAIYYEREDQLIQQVKSALTYPLVLILMIAVILGVLTNKILPVFLQVLDGLSDDYSAGSFHAVNLGIAAGHFAVVSMLLIGFIILFVLLISGTPKGRAYSLTLAIRLPFLTKIINLEDSAQFASALSILLSSGYDVSEALHLLPNILQNPRNLVNAKKAALAVEGGTSLTTALQQTGLFTGVHFSMLRAGESTGNLEKVLNKIAEKNNDEAMELISRRIAFIEPLLVGLVSVIIGTLLLSVMLPLIGIMSSIA